MKTVNLFFGILFITLLSTSFTSAQERTSLNIQRTIELKNESQIKEVKIEVNEKECRFNLKITSLVHGGEVKVEIYDPNGKKQGNFSVGCEIQSENSKETVNGMITKLIENPDLGNWKVKIIPKKAIGKLSILFSQDVIIRNTNN